MGNKICNCNVGLGNTGQGKCDPIHKTWKKLIFVQYFDNDGVVNYIDPTDTLDETYFNTLVNNPDTDKRGYPLPTLENVENTRADNVTFAYNSGKTQIVDQGIKTFTARIPNVSAAWVGKVKEIGCVQAGIWSADKVGNLLGDGSDITQLKPIRVDKDTFDIRFIEETEGSEPSYALMTFQFDQSHQDEDIRMIKKTDIDYNLFNLRGLVDVYANDIVPVSTSQVTFTAETIYGSLTDIEKITGLTTAEISLFNVTTGLPVVATTVTEGNPGEYTVDFAAQTSADVMYLIINKNGLDDYQANQETFILP